MGSLERRLEKLEGRIEPPEEDEAQRRQAKLEKRRAEIRAELEAFEARRRGMSEAERKAAWERLEAWRESPEGQADRRALEAELERRRGGWGA